MPSNPTSPSLKQDATLTMVGLPEKPPSVHPFNLITKRCSIAGSMIGGMAETQQMLDYCGQHNIAAEVEVIPIQKINEAFERMLKQDVKYRFVIDMSSLLKSFPSDLSVAAGGV